MKRALLAFAAGLVALAMTAPLCAADAGAVKAAIERELGRNPAPGRSSAAIATRWPLVQAFYEIAGHAPAWFVADAARPAVAKALDLLRNADARGLEPGDYDVVPLAEALAAARAGDASPEAVAHADVAMTAAMLGLLSDLHDGRLRPREFESRDRSREADRDIIVRLRAAAADNRIGVLIDTAEPSFPLYARLKRLLARYRALAAEPMPPLPPLPPTRRRIDPGESYEGVAMLHDRLVLLGDLAASAGRPTDNRYSATLIVAVTRFQERHGLTPDGVIGRATLAELEVPLRRRIDQIALSLERLRWLPDLPPGPLIVVNIPSFRLWAFADARASERPALAMPVIVGRALRTQTPVFIGDMRYVEFSPYWNVPPSILRGEILPALQRDPGYLQREDMELVSAGRDATITTSVDAAALAALQSGALRVRQRPGPRNALDGIKFVLPNTMDIYLHGTPAAALFDRTRRDFSHGCIRVADPAALARFVLRDQPEWSAARIDSAMTSGRMTTAKLTGPIPVVVFYTTAIVGTDDRARFMADVYGHDRELMAALQAARPPGR